MFSYRFTLPCLTSRIKYDDTQTEAAFSLDYENNLCGCFGVKFVTMFRSYIKLKVAVTSNQLRSHRREPTRPLPMSLCVFSSTVRRISGSVQFTAAALHPGNASVSKATEVTPRWGQKVSEATSL